MSQLDDWIAKHAKIQMQKALYYHFVTSSDSHFDTDPSEFSDNPKPLPHADPIDSDNNTGPNRLSQEDTKLCIDLMSRTIDYFTPILFTPPATSHMACTDVFADTWMSLVIQPAIENDGVYKPLETLESLKGIDWGKLGLCDACVREKQQEWTDEQLVIWKAMDGWLGLASP
ncbi:hypothetical protein H0H81_007728 [Sphagnurus paluster]|uniref:Uncharacterized protein n=1 Tax=Sphagnurus paluster TaxID=117069 RepID=A0A9P7FT12_9AGAR|nr:hypothetical protein H0H81_007728 [Sphagnurus paluster]